MASFGEDDILTSPLQGKETEEPAQKSDQTDAPGTVMLGPECGELEGMKVEGETQQPEEDEDEEPHGEEDVIEPELSSEIGLALEYDPADHLTATQIQAGLRIIQFPNMSAAEIAKSVGVHRNTIHNWKRDEHFQAFMTESKNKLVERTISVRATRNAHLFDKVSAEMISRFDEPETDPAMLQQILGDANGKYTHGDLVNYRKRFVHNMPVKDLFTIWSSLEGNVREDEREIGNEENFNTLFAQLQEQYEKVQIMKRKQNRFRERTGFGYDVDYNESNVIDIYSERANADAGDDEVIDAEFVESQTDTTEENDGSILDSFSID